MNFLEILTHLSQDKMEFVIIGGVAARLHGSTRLTHDIDIVPRLEPESWKNLIQKIWELDTRPRIPESKERIQNLENIRRWMHEKHMLALTFRSTSGHAEIDLVIAESHQFEGLKARAIQVDLNGQTIYIACIDDLIKLKQKAGRPQDILDVETLLNIKEKRG